MKLTRATRNPEYIAIALGAAQAIGFAWAMVIAEGGNGWLTLIFAVLRGGLLGFALAFVLILTAHAVPRITAKRARVLGWSALVGLLIVSPVIIAPAIQYSIPESVLSGFWPRWIWAGAIAFSPDLVAIGLAATGKVGAVDNQPQPAATKTTKTKKVDNPPATVEQLELNEVNLVAYMAQPNATQAGAANYFKVSPQAISKRMNKEK